MKVIDYVGESTNVYKYIELNHIYLIFARLINTNAFVFFLSKRYPRSIFRQRFPYNLRLNNLRRLNFSRNESYLIKTPVELYKCTNK